MGRKKNKWFKKVILFYRYVFKFEVPYKIIIDGNMLAVALKKKLDLKEYLTKLPDENVHIIIPSCVLAEVKMLDKELPGLLNIAMRFKVEECNHQVLTPDNCIKTYIGKRNFKKYFVATQDEFLRRQLRRIVATPLLFFDQNMMLIEKPSSVSMEAYHRRENLKQEPRKFEKKELTDKKEEIKEFMKEEYMKSQHFKKKIEDFKINKIMGRIKKHAKGPNPLSVKKKRNKREHDGKTLNSEEAIAENSNQHPNNNLEDGNVQPKKRERKRFKKNKANN